MHAIIELQKLGAFVKKIELEWADCIDHTVWETSTEVYVHLIEDIAVISFVDELMPKVGMFIDFKSSLIMHYVEYNGGCKKSLVFNLENELVSVFNMQQNITV